MDGFPERYHVLPTLKEVGQFIGRVLAPLPEGGYPSDYRPGGEKNHNRGAAAMLDAALYEPTDGEPIVIERTDIAQLHNTGGRWSDMGTY